MAIHQSRTGFQPVCGGSALRVQTGWKPVLLYFASVERGLNLAPFRTDTGDISEKQSIEPTMMNPFEIRPIVREEWKMLLTLMGDFDAAGTLGFVMTEESLWRQSRPRLRRHTRPRQRRQKRR